MVRRIGLIGLLGCAALFGQRSDTIYQQLGIKTTVGGGPGGYTQDVNNIGQTGHTLFVSLTNNGSTCFSPALNVSFQYSWDDTNFFQFGYRTVDIAGTTSAAAQTATVQATGAFPYVRALATWNSACTASIFYTGVVNTPYPYVQGILALDTPVVNTNNQFINPVVQGVVAVQSNGLGVVAANYQGDVTTAINVTASSTLNIINGVSTTSDRVYVDHLDVVGDAASTVVTVIEGTGTTCGTGTATLGSWKLASGVPLTVGKFRTQTVGDNLCLTAATGNVTGSITYGVMVSTALGH